MERRDWAGSERVEVPTKHKLYLVNTDQHQSALGLQEDEHLCPITV